MPGFVRPTREKLASHHNIGDIGDFTKRVSNECKLTKSRRCTPQSDTLGAAPPHPRRSGCPSPRPARRPAPAVSPSGARARSRTPHLRLFHPTWPPQARRGLLCIVRLHNRMVPSAARPQQRSMAQREGGTAAQQRHNSGSRQAARRAPLLRTSAGSSRAAGGRGAGASQPQQNPAADSGAPRSTRPAAAAYSDASFEAPTESPAALESPASSESTSGDENEDSAEAELAPGEYIVERALAVRQRRKGGMEVRLRMRWTLRPGYSIP